MLDVIFTSIGMAQGAHAATVHLEQDHVMEDLRGVENAFRNFHHFRIGS